MPTSSSSSSSTSHGFAPLTFGGFFFILRMVGCVFGGAHLGDEQYGMRCARMSSSMAFPATCSPHWTQVAVAKEP